MTGQVVTAADVMRECVSLCVSVICHSCLHSLESCLSEGSPREGTQQLMMSWCLYSEMWLWSCEEGFRRSCRGHGTAGLRCCHIYSHFSWNLCGTEFCNTKFPTQMSLMFRLITLIWWFHQKKTAWFEVTPPPSLVLLIWIQVIRNFFVTLDNGPFLPTKFCGNFATVTTP